MKPNTSTSWLKLALPAPMRKILARTVPLFVTLFVYKLICRLGVRFLRSRLRDDNFQVWPRNSLVLRSVRFGTSDIDLTVVSARGSSSESVRRFASVAADLRRWLPVFGEVNWYNEEDLPEVAELMNVFELERDPTLLALLLREGHLENISVRRNDPVEKFIFLARMIYYDGRDLHRAPRSRYHKWKSHFEMVGLKPIPSQEISADRVLAAAAALLDLSPCESARLVQTLKDIALNNARFLQGTYDGPALRNPDWVWALFPYSIGYYGLPMPKLLDIQFELLERQMGWELFGMLTQHRHQSDEMLLPTHLRVVTKTFLSAQTKRLEPVIEKTENVLSRLLHYNTI